MKRVFYAFAIFIFISFMMIGYVLNYLTHSSLHQAIEVKVKRDLGILATITQGALANNDYERVEEQVFLWGELEPNIAFFNVILDGDIEIVKFAREIQTSNTLHLTQTIPLPSGRIVTFSIEYDLSAHDKKATVIAFIFPSMSCCIAVVFIFLLWRILENLAFIPLNREIVERKRAEEEREKLLKTLVVKNKELQSIVYVASHDLRSPLVNIDGFSGELAKAYRQLREMLDNESIDDDLKRKLLELLDENVPESIRFVKAGTAKMSNLIDGLLQVSRVGGARVKIKPLDMNKMMDDIRQSMEFQFKDTGAEIIIDDLPGCLGDASQIKQLCSNLVGNAIKYLDPKRKGKIHITGRVENSQSIYCIEDNGIGINPAYQSKIFEMFHRLNPDDSAGGEGIGLTIVTRILHRNNGTIRVESEQGKGSKFFVSLPTAKA